LTTVKRPLRVYADTSVFGGCYDEEFKAESVRFFDELELAPDAVRGVLAGLPPDQVEIVGTSPESDGLRGAYHIAVATVSGVDLVVSWNFKHIVHFEKIGGYEGVNSLRGYRSPRIYSPREVVTP